MVITARNPVHAVLFLILCFFNVSGLFVLLGAEFLAFMLVIVYAGALSVLFLFIVMMLDIDFSSLRQDMVKYTPISILIAGVLLVELLLLFQGWGGSSHIAGNLSEHPILSSEDMTNTKAIGAVLYTDYVYAFQLSGLVLFVAMIGTITLTLRDTHKAKRQRVSEQTAVKPEDILNIQKVTPGVGM